MIGITLSAAFHPLRLKYSKDRPNGSLEIRSRNNPEEYESTRKKLARALRNHNLWLTLGYVSILLLMVRAYA